MLISLSKRSIEEASDEKRDRANQKDVISFAGRAEPPVKRRLSRSIGSTSNS
jgi:hypothetical protein